MDNYLLFLLAWRVLGPAGQLAYPSSKLPSRPAQAAGAVAKGKCEAAHHDA